MTSLKLDNCYDEISKKHKIFWFIIFFSSLVGVATSLTGSILDIWSVNIDYWYIFLTNWVNSIILIFYAFVSLFALFNFQKGLNLLVRQKILVGLAGLSGIIVLVVVLILGPMSALHRLGIGPGAVPDDSNHGKETMLIGGLILNSLVHFIVPVLVIVDLFTIKFKQKIKIKDNFPVILILSIYLMFALTFGYFTDDYPYTIIDPNHFGFFIILFIFAVSFIHIIWISLITYYFNIRHKNMEDLKKNN